MGPEEARLQARVAEMKANGTKKLSFSWTPHQDKLNAEEACLIMNQWLDAMDAHSALSTEEKMLRDIKLAYDHVKQAVRQCQFNLRDYTVESSKEAVDDLHSRLSTAFGHMDIASLHLGNWTRNSKETV